MLRHNASRLARARVGAPVVVAGNEDAIGDVMATLTSTGRSAVAAANVLPRIGTLEPESARSAIREVFLRHVIGGKGLSRGPRFASLVRAATPDAVLSGVEVVADGAPQHGVPALGDVLVVDVGGATTDVYSVITPQGEDATLRKEVVAPMWRARTVEGDLGMRWGATATVEAALAERLVETADAQRLEAAARRRVAEPGWLPTTYEDVSDDLHLARLAVTVALRRHARPPSETKGGKDLRRVVAVIGSGGVLRYADRAGRDTVLAPATGDHAGGWRVPEQPVLAVDEQSVLCAAGLLRDDHPRAAALLAHGLVRSGRLTRMRADP